MQFEQVNDLEKEIAIISSEMMLYKARCEALEMALKDMRFTINVGQAVVLSQMDENEKKANETEKKLFKVAEDNDALTDQLEKSIQLAELQEAMQKQATRERNSARRKSVIMHQNAMNQHWEYRIEAEKYEAAKEIIVEFAPTYKSLLMERVEEAIKRVKDEKEKHDRRVRNSKASTSTD